MNILEILLGQVPEAIFFAMFVILTKSLKERRCLFILLMVIEYLILKIFFKYNIWFQILYTTIACLTIKLLYGQKSQIIDVFTFTIASLILVISSILAFLVFRPNMIIIAIANRILLFVFLYLFRNQLPKIQKVYCKLWNRNDTVKKKMKSTTFRSLNMVIFNVLFYGINLGAACAIWYNALRR